MMPGERHSGDRRDSRPSAVLYVHVPFCLARCAYCDFNTYAGLKDVMPAYVEGLRREIEAAGERWGPLHVRTMYMGGGTPSLLPLNLASDLIGAVRATFDLSHRAEITIEANPGTVNEAHMSGLRSLGIDRLSLGVQSSRDDELQMLGRVHSWRDVVRAVDAARASGFANLNLDLLFGLPNQSLDGWKETLEKAVELDPEHLSLYGLSIEKGTPLARRITSGELTLPDDERAATMYEMGEHLLARAGFFHYEISNWAKVDDPPWPVDGHWWPGPEVWACTPERSESISPYVCRHNLSYWRNEPWLGVGAGAHSWMPAEALSHVSNLPKEAAKGERWANVDHPEDYVAVSGKIAYPDSLRREVEVIDRELEMGDTMMLGLRLAEGVRAGWFEARFGTELKAAFGEQLTSLRQLGLLAWDGRVARLTARGRLLGNRVFERFIR